ncbi:MAG: hypothetical protein ACR2NN_04750 [Bryobacteraceae bacterium]
MDALSTAIAAKKERLDKLRPVSQKALLGLQKSYDVNLTVGGKSLRDHLEVVDHYNAVLSMRELGEDHPKVKRPCANFTGASLSAASPKSAVFTAHSLAALRVRPSFFPTRRKFRS